MPMPSWNDIPFFKDLGGEHLVLDIAPKEGCLDCGNWNWDYAIVNTSKRCDLLTNKPLKTWSAKSVCQKCGTTSLWSIYPDKPYPKTNDSLPE